jgi:hypothetical protein
MMYLTGAAKLLQASGWLTKLALAGALALAVLGAYGIWHHKVFQSGYDRALADVAAEDARAIGRATDLRSTWLACRKTGRRWIQSEGKCA